MAEKKKELVVQIRPWAKDDLALLEQLASGPPITGALSRSPADEPITARHERYVQSRASARGPVMVILAGPALSPVGTIGYWHKVWRGEHLWELSWRVLAEPQADIALAALQLVLRKIRSDGSLRFLHAFPTTTDPWRNQVCRAAEFTRLEEVQFDDPPGDPIRCNHWRLDLAPRASWG